MQSADAGRGNNMGRGNPRAVTGTHTTPVGDELMVHVVGTAETHLLSSTTASVWQRCDGRASRVDLESVFADQPAELRPELVQLALDQLEKAGLVEDGGDSSDLQRESRRRFLRKAAIAAVAVPTITTVVTAQPAAASSHETTGCSSANPCPDNQLCNASTGVCYCENNNNCASNQACVSGTCGPCSSASQCRSGQACVSQTCQATCDGDTTCRSTEYCCASSNAGCVVGTCTARRGTDETCSRSGQCTSGCCRNGTCKTGAGSCAPQ